LTRFFESSPRSRREREERGGKVSLRALPGKRESSRRVPEGQNEKEVAVLHPN